MEPDKYIPCAQIDVVEFPEGVGGDRIEEKIFKGPLHQQLREALRYIQNSVIKERIIKYPDRAEADRFFNYPYAAIEESLANAVYHKAYDIREPIEVRIEKEKIEILSFPGPDRSVTVEALKNYNVFVRRYRNRRIGDFLKELHLTEGRNTGFKKILNALEKNGSPLPEFLTDDDHSFFITRLFIRDGFIESGTDDDTENGTVNGTVNGTANGTVNSIVEDIAKKVPATGTLIKAYSRSKQKTACKIVVELLKNDGLTLEQIVDVSGVSRRTVARYMKEFQEAGVLRREGSDKNGKWVLS